MINIKLNEDTKCVVIRNGDEEVINYPKGTCFMDVEVSPYDDQPTEWLSMDDDMVATFIPQNKATQLQ